MKDHIVEEVLRIKEEEAAQYDFDIDRIFAAAHEYEKTCGHKVVDLSKKRKTG